MRIERLSITGFGPFRHAQVIDFAKFNNDLFLITGKTGAGKSSILDAICFAFYGDIPRYDKTDSALRSDHCEPEDPTEVELEFSLGEDRYRILRSPEYQRPAKRGGGMTTQSPKASLERFEGEKYTAVTAAPRETNIEISGILRLSKAQFLQVILLAQGRFQDFLKANSEDRLGVLRSLFETTRYEKLEKKLDDRRKGLASGIDTAKDAVARYRADAVALLQSVDLGTGEPTAGVPDQPSAQWYAEQFTALTALVGNADTAATTAEAVRATANTELDRLRGVERRQKERTEAQSTLARLAQQADARESDTLALDADRRGTAIIPQLEAHGEAVAAANAAATDLVDATADAALGTPPPVDAAAAREREQDADRVLGSLESALSDEATLPTLTAQWEAAEQEVVAANEAVTSLGSRATELPALLAAAQPELQRHSAAAALEPAARNALEQTKISLAAAERAVEACATLAAHLETMLMVSTNDAKAALRHTELLHQQLAGYAGVLASTLVTGEPCPVCGAREHPAPATTDESTVTQDDVDLAKAAMEACRAELDAASTLRGQIEAEIAAAEGASGSRSVDDLTEALHEATQSLGEAEKALTDADLSRTLIRELGAELTETTAESARLADLAAEARARRDPLAISVRDVAARCEAARDDFESVVGRAESLQAHRAALARFRSASETVAQAHRAEQKAADRVDAQLAEQGFASRADVGATHLTDTDRTAVTERIRLHQKEGDVARGILSTLADVPEAQVELDAATDAFTAAGVHRDATRDAQIATQKTRTEFAALLEAVSTHDATHAALLSEYELIQQLAAAVAGKTPNTKAMKLETYVLAAELEDIVSAANQRLTVMTSGRYLLLHDDKVEFRNVRGGLGLEILDQYSGRVRPTHSLSGGETFLASLALALGLAEVVSARSGAVKLDTLFIDEGFGSLDADTLELAMTTLDSLRAGGRTIGIISHVETMKEQVHTQLRVEVGEQGDSRVRV